MDKVTLERIKTIHPKLRKELGEIYEEICSRLNKGVICRFPFVYRSIAEQDALFAQGRNGDKRPRVTNARGGQSYHNYGLAVDIVLLQDRDGNGSYETASWDNKIDFDKDGMADWQEVVAVFKMYGWEWGGDWRNFPDTPHFQKTFGKTVIELREMVRQFKVIDKVYPII